MIRADLQKRVHRWAPVATVAVVLVDAVLLATGTITPRQALWLFLVVEVPLLCISAAGLGLAIQANRRRGDTFTTATRGVFAQSPIALVVRTEVRAYRALWMWVRRRYDVEPGAVALPADRGMLTLPLAFAVATVIEIVVLDLLLPWMWARIAVAVVSVWSLVMLFGFVAVGRAFPHYLTDTDLVLRRSGSTVAVVHRDNIAKTVRHRRFSHTTPTIDDGHLFLPNPDGTCIDVVLRSPVAASLPTFLPHNRTTQSVHRVSLHLDDPTLLHAARAPTHPTTSAP